MAGSFRKGRLRHLRHRRLNGFDRGSAAVSGRSRLPRLEAWLEEREGALKPTGVETTFTAAASDICTAVGHPYATTEGPMLVASAGTLPGGLSSTELYWIRVESVDTFTLYRSRQDASLGTNRVDITDTGTGAHTIFRADTVPGLVEWLRLNGVGSDLLSATTDIDDLPIA